MKKPLVELSEAGACAPARSGVWNLLALFITTFADGVQLSFGFGFQPQRQKQLDLENDNPTPKLGTQPARTVFQALYCDLGLCIDPWWP